MSLRRLNLILLLIITLPLTGCYQETFNATPFDLREIGLVHQQGGRQFAYTLPARTATSSVARLPASVAIARVQTDRGSAGEASLTFRNGRFVGVRHLVRDHHEKALIELEGIVDVVPLAPPPSVAGAKHIDVIEAIRHEALRAKAELLLLLTFETDAESRNLLPPLSLLTLGTLPQDVASADCAGHAVLMDARTGHVFAYGSVEKDAWQIANAWTAREATDDSARRSERKVLSELIARLKPQWPAIVPLMK